jgi:hypothetical protein
MAQERQGRGNDAGGWKRPAAALAGLQRDGERVSGLLFDAFAGLWPRVEIDIIRFDTSAGVPDKATVYTALKAYRSQKEIKEAVGPFQEVGRKVVDVFYVPTPQDDVILEISEAYQVRWRGADRKILSATDQGGLGEMIELLTERVR